MRTISSCCPFTGFPTGRGDGWSGEMKSERVEANCEINCAKKALAARILPFSRYLQKEGAQEGSVLFLSF